MHAVVAAGASIVTHVRSVLFSVLSDIGTPWSLDVQQIADQRRAISAFGVGLSRQAQTESTPKSSRTRYVSRSVSWGTMDGVRMKILP